ncbi:MAG: ImmA/IrrE family metallo-endopeptidase [Terriglobales bacterium]
MNHASHPELFPKEADEPAEAEASPGTDKLGALDELFQSTATYRSSKAYLDLMKFISRFPKYAPFNCFLLHTQNPSVTYVATPSQWRSRFGRTIRADARPLVILAPMRPVIFVYDLEDTEGDHLPARLERPFETHGRLPKQVWERTLTNCQDRDRIAISYSDFSRLQAGSAQMNTSSSVRVGRQQAMAKCVVALNRKHSAEEQYATLVHELAHIHCGHLGADPDEWWPDRKGLKSEQREFEAESVSFLVCRRLSLDTPAVHYLAGYVESRDGIPRISLEAVLRVSGYIESLGGKLLPERRPRTKKL